MWYLMGPVSLGLPGRLIGLLLVMSAGSTSPIVSSHIARKHPELVVPREQPRARAYTQHTIDGMPQCCHCHKKFTRVEGLKKHLRQACTVLHARPAVPATATTGDAASTAGVAQEPTPRELSCEGPAAPVEVAGFGSARLEYQSQST